MPPEAAAAPGPVVARVGPLAAAGAPIVVPAIATVMGRAPLAEPGVMAPEGPIAPTPPRRMAPVGLRAARADRKGSRPAPLVDPRPGPPRPACARAATARRGHRATELTVADTPLVAPARVAGSRRSTWVDAPVTRPHITV